MEVYVAPACTLRLQMLLRYASVSERTDENFICKTNDNMARCRKGKKKTYSVFEMG